MDEEGYLKILKDSAVQRFGKKNAQDIETAISEMARSLKTVRDFPVETEEMPAFYL